MQNRFKILSGIALATVLVAGFVIVAFAPAFRPSPAVNVQRVMTALELHKRDYRARGEPAPPTVTLAELIAAGHLAEADARSFQGASVVFHHDADENRPQSVLGEARLPDGSTLVVLADGSVQQIPSARARETQAQSGQSSQPGQGTPPVRGE